MRPRRKPKLISLEINKSCPSINIFYLLMCCFLILYSTYTRYDKYPTNNTYELTNMLNIKCSPNLEKYYRGIANCLEETKPKDN